MSANRIYFNSLKAEWLYSQGKGRGYQVGEHTALVHYLSGICLAGGGWGGADLPDEDAKLGKILQLAKFHQQGLRSFNGSEIRYWVRLSAHTFCILTILCIVFNMAKALQRRCVSCHYND